MGWGSLIFNFLPEFKASPPPWVRLLQSSAVFLDQPPRPPAPPAAHRLTPAFGSVWLWGSPWLAAGPSCTSETHSLLHAVPVRSRSTSGVQSFTRDVA